LKHRETAKREQRDTDVVKPHVRVDHLILFVLQRHNASIAQIPLGSTRYVSTRHANYSPCILA